MSLFCLSVLVRNIFDFTTKEIDNILFEQLSKILLLFFWQKQNIFNRHKQIKIFLIIN